MLYVWNCFTFGTYFKTYLEFVKLKVSQQECFRMCRRQTVLRSTMEVFKDFLEDNPS